eukprot:3206360-Amphidinium_carterae.1
MDTSVPLGTCASNSAARPHHGSYSLSLESSFWMVIIAGLLDVLALQCAVAGSVSRVAIGAPLLGRIYLSSHVGPRCVLCHLACHPTSKVEWTVYHSGIWLRSWLVHLVHVVLCFGGARKPRTLCLVCCGQSSAWIMAGRLIVPFVESSGRVG